METLSTHKKLKDLLEAALNGIDSFSRLTLLSLNVSGHLCYPNAALRSVKANSLCSAIKCNSGQNGCKGLFQYSISKSIYMEDTECIPATRAKKTVKNTQKPHDDSNSLFWKK